MTIGQRRSDAIASSPMGACASVPRNTASAMRRTHSDNPGTRRTASQASSVTTIVTPPTRRLPNSTNACAFFAGNGCPVSQPGQARQPRPESVRRTAAPGADDEPERAELRKHQRIDLRGSQDERPQPSERRGLGVHGVESIQRGSRIAG